MATTITLQDYIEIGNLAYEWTQGYDMKDTERLKRILASKVQLDYRSVGGVLREDITPDEFADILMGMIGDKRLRTQHLIGAGKIEQLSDDAVHAEYQIRAAHQRYAKEDLAEVINKGHDYGTVQHRYRKIDGVWKIEGVRPTLDWSEYDIFGTLTPPSQ